MKIRQLFIGFGILAGAWILCTHDPISAQAPAQKTNPAPPAPVLTKSDCLGCHGPFEQIIAATSDYVAPSGEKLSPHRYVPHDSAKEDKNIPECTVCHVAHSLDPLPTKGSIDMSKMRVQWCYDSCHHQGNFTPCQECHT